MINKRILLLVTLSFIVLEGQSQESPSNAIFIPKQETVGETGQRTQAKLAPVYRTPSLVNTADVIIDANASRTHSENSVFISPIDPNYVIMSTNYINLSFIAPNGVTAFASQDAGMTWTGIGTQLNSSLADPTTAIDLQGNSYIGYIYASNYGQAISKSTDGGTSWNQVVIANGVGSSNPLDKNCLAVDNSQNTLDVYSDNLYTGWTNFITGSPNNSQIEASVSSDGGLSWSTPQNISADVSAGFVNQGVNMQTGPNGEVYACWAIYDVTLHEDAIGFNSSVDGGNSWNVSTRIQSINGHRDKPLGGFKTMKHNSFPVMAVNHQNGFVYVCYTNYDVDNVNIYIIRSEDQGATWSSPIRINQDVTNDQWFPWIACDELNGAITVIYYDSRNIPGDDQAEVFLSISYDNGNTWYDFPISDVPWSADGVSSLGNYAGDYIGVDIYNGFCVPAWTDDRDGLLHSYAQPTTIPCPDNLTACNGKVQSPAFLHAVSDITIGNNIACSYTIEPNGTCEMSAGNGIKLKEGFKAKAGSNFKAFINPSCDVGGERSNEIIEQPNKSSLSVSKVLYSLYPNPNTGIMNLEIDPDASLNVVKVEIFNSFGSKIWEAENFEINTQSIDITDHSKGMYYLRVIDSEGKSHVERMIRN